jgi:hypothetical protein
MHRPHLVVVRAGDRSIHKNWLKSSESRSWDLVVSWYGRERYRPVADERFIVLPGGKLGGLRKTFNLLPDLLERYDYIWLPDDDIDTRCASIERVFAIMRQDRLLLAQPSLTMNSYFTWVHTLNCPPLRLRYTNHVEMMMPCFDTRLLRDVLPHLPGSIAGWGVDQIWCRLAKDNNRKAAIIDAVAMRHTRPVGNLFRIAEAAGEDTLALSEAYGRSFGHRATPAICYAAKLWAGEPEIGRQVLAQLMLLSYRLRAHRNPESEYVRERAWKYVQNQRSFPLDLSPLTPPPL